jgi:mannose-1-phosphate guanylyltransferase
MKCIILVGGFGTRLRPLTFTLPKPLVPFCNKSIVEHQIAAAVKAGVKHVILAVGWKADDMKEALEEFKQRYKIEVTCSVEDVPLGTAGPIRLAESILRDGADDEPFFVFNSDVICNFPLSSMLKYHKAHGGAGTICVTKVDDPSKYGVLVSDKHGKIERFVEKPATFISDKINAGLYILNKSVIDRIDAGVFRMIETDVFPQLANEGKIYSFELPGYWADIGQPKDFIRGMKMHLAAHAANPDEPLTPRSKLATISNTAGYELKGSTVIVGKNTTIGEGSVIGPHVVLGDNCVVGKGVRLSNCCVFEGCRISDYAQVNEVILGWNNKVGRWTKLENSTVTGEDVVFTDELFINGAIVLPHKAVKEKILEAGKIIM